MRAGVAELTVDVRDESLVRVDADCAVVAVFDDQRPLRGGAGLVDWRLCGRLSEALGDEALEGWVLLPSEGRLATPRILVGSLGTLSELDFGRLSAFACEAGRRALGLRADRVVWDLGLGLGRIAAEAAASSVVAGLRKPLAEAGAALELLFCVPPEEALRFRVAVERAVARQPRGDTPFRLRTADTAGTPLRGSR